MEGHYGRLPLPPELPPPPHSSLYPPHPQNPSQNQNHFQNLPNPGQLESPFPNPEPSFEGESQSPAISAKTPPKKRKSNGGGAGVKTPLKPIECPECGKEISNKWNLKSHLNNVHIGIRHECHICETSFTFKGSLKRHIDNVHFKLPRTTQIYPCPVCGREFNRSDIMYRHVDVVHDGLKRYPCNFCHRGFSHKDDLQYHIVTVHKKFRFRNKHEWKQFFEDSAIDFEKFLICNEASDQTQTPMPNCDGVKADSLEELAKARKKKKKHKKKHPDPGSEEASNNEKLSEESTTAVTEASQLSRNDLDNKKRLKKLKKQLRKERKRSKQKQRNVLEQEAHCDGEGVNVKEEEQEESFEQNQMFPTENQVASNKIVDQPLDSSINQSKSANSQNSELESHYKARQ